MLSSMILNYPIPILMNWNALESDDPFRLHLGKIDSVLNYLKTFPPEKDDDLVLLVDGYDVWMQLPPEIIVRRYYDVIEKQQEWLTSHYGAEAVRKYGLRSSVLFGPDKACWPDEEDGLSRAACWAVPQSLLPKYSFGPFDDTDFKVAALDQYHARPRWLNSGTVIGPVSEIRNVYEASSRLVRDHHVTDSDQFYFADVWGIQEFARLGLESNVIYPVNVSIPSIEEGHRTEYHISLDYDASLFQTVGYYDPFIIWLRYDGTLQAGKPEGSPIPKLDHFELEKDILSLRPPLAAISSPSPQAGKAINMQLPHHATNVSPKGWKEMLLATNLITKHVPALIHMMMEKEYRVKWWKNMWFTPYARELKRASSVEDDSPISEKPINGRMWYRAEGPVIKFPQESSHGRRDGAWSDRGAWIPWSDLCGAHEEFLFGPAG